MNFIIPDLLILCFLAILAWEDYKHQEVKAVRLIAFCLFDIALYFLFFFGSGDSPLVTVGLALALIGSMVMFSFGKLKLADWMVVMATCFTIVGPLAFFLSLLVSLMYGAWHRGVRKYPYLVIYFASFLVIWLVFLL
jgi:hypothetical protein